jgi:RimJ/RimL family protein N-acetyltransferase
MAEAAHPPDRASRPPLLATSRLVLRELAAADAPAIARGAGDPRVAQFLLAVPVPYPVALAQRWITARRAWWARGRGVTLAIARRDRPAALLGTVSLQRAVGARRAELGYWLAAPAWGRGYATEAAAALIDYGFRELGLARIDASVFTDNAASAHVLGKLGMVARPAGAARGRRAARALARYSLRRDDWTRDAPGARLLRPTA